MLGCRHFAIGIGYERNQRKGSDKAMDMGYVVSGLSVRLISRLHVQG